MPHLKCIPCRIRAHSPYPPVDGVGELCPGCGFLLEPVADLSELVGLRATRLDPDSAQEDFDSGRWLDDGGGPLPERLVQAMALPRPDRSDA